MTEPGSGDIWLAGIGVQRQMQCAEEDLCLNREWTRMNANKVKKTAK